MKLIIDIPKEFECNYIGDKFKDFFLRVLCDIDKGVLCGNYEKETVGMFLKAFDESVPVANIVEKLEEMIRPKQLYFCKYVKGGCKHLDNDAKDCMECIVEQAINIVKQEINNGENNT